MFPSDMCMFLRKGVVLKLFQRKVSQLIYRVKQGESGDDTYLLYYLFIKKRNDNKI